MILTYIITTLLSFTVRAIFVRQLGSQYLGLNGVFASILSVLTISDLGMESVFSFLLYKPIALNDEIKVRSLTALFRKVYNFVGLFIFSLGIIIIPFLPVIIGNHGNNLQHVTLIYFIMLLNSAGSYLFTYNRTILNADQRNYIITIVNFILISIINILQMIFLVFIHSMVVYVSLFLFSTLMTNVILSRIVINQYPYLKKLPKNPYISQKDKRTLWQNTIGGLSNKLGSIIVFSSDNILLSIYVNLTMVGLYSNYTMIISSITNLIQKAIGTLTASIGNLSVESPTKALSVFRQLNSYITFVSFFVAPQLLTLLRPLIVLWLGEKYVLSQYIVLLIVVNFILQISRTPALIYVDAYGLQWIQKWKSIIESVLNILFSVIALEFFKLGLIGILLGTIGSTLLYVLWYEPLVVLKYGLKMDNKEQFISLVKILLEKLWLIIPSLCTWLIIHFFQGRGMFFLIEMIVINFIISILLFLIIFGRKDEFKLVLQMFFSRLR